ncbi:TetR/AcrR family transcriptional regulator [Enterovirga sp. CN4-39]|uniref:TetR/AcrR family transcriptional regulator n=1 Tax=Enterovirga sp. CN4-39 TaxID=3400910 RepID=UPI003C0C5E2E
MALDQREALLEAGLAVVHSQGFVGTGVREIAAAANVPQGSFTNHFRSKEGFGLLVLDRYFERLDAIMQATLANPALAPEARLWAYFDTIGEALSEADWQRGCMVVDLAAEIPARSDAIRERLVSMLGQQSAQFEAVLRLIQPEEDGAAADLAAFILAAWQGTLLRMKTERSGEAVARFRRVLARLIGPPLG